MFLNWMITKLRPLAIYVHIPFCVRKCNYCDFLSGPADRKSKEEYVRALFKEIESYRELAKEYQVQTIFLGGGTPSSIDADFIVQIMNRLEDVFGFHAKDNPSMEITIEINPGTVTKEKLQMYYDAGINRISFGLQSACDEELLLLGRIHTFEQFVDNYQMARIVGFKNINIDLMSALPGQTLESYQHTLEKVMALDPEHISAYSLIIEEGTPFYELYGEESTRKPEKELPSEEQERLMYEKTKEWMHQHGYERYEISNYARPGYECIHNCTYWRRGDYLGIGSGAASLIQDQRFSNERDLKRYIELANQDERISAYHDELHVEKEQLSLQDKMEEFMYLGLRMMKGVSMKEFKAYFGKSFEEVYGSVANKLIEEDLLKVQDGWISLTDHGIDISNYVMSEFLLDNELI